MSETDWEARLRAQGVDEERIAAAKQAAQLMADALEEVTFTAEEPLTPEHYRQVLAACARGKGKP